MGRVTYTGCCSPAETPRAFATLVAPLNLLLWRLSGVELRPSWRGWFTSLGLVVCSGSWIERSACHARSQRKTSGNTALMETDPCRQGTARSARTPFDVVQRR